MTLSDSATAQLWETLNRASGGAGLIREAVELVLQELIEAEATEAIGASCERSDMRVTERNGHRSRLLATQAGDVELKIPKLRRGSFFPSMLEPRRRIDRALWAVVMEAYVAGVSTRSVDDLVATSRRAPCAPTPARSLPPVRANTDRDVRRLWLSAVAVFAA